MPSATAEMLSPKQAESVIANAVEGRSEWTPLDVLLSMMSRGPFFQTHIIDGNHHQYVTWDEDACSC